MRGGGAGGSDTCGSPKNTLMQWETQFKGSQIPFLKSWGGGSGKGTVKKVMVVVEDYDQQHLMLLICCLVFSENIEISSFFIW